MAEWVKVALVSELTEKHMKPVRLGDEHLAVVMVDGVVSAFEDYCTHAWCSFTPGDVEDDQEVLCLCHYAKFNYHTGEVIWGPAWTPLKIFQVRVDGDEVLIELEKAPPD